MANDLTSDFDVVAKIAVAAANRNTYAMHETAHFFIPSPFAWVTILPLAQRPPAGRVRVLNR